jgi:hypothetical protein
MAGMEQGVLSVLASTAMREVLEVVLVPMGDLQARAGGQQWVPYGQASQQNFSGFNASSGPSLQASGLWKTTDGKKGQGGVAEIEAVVVADSTQQLGKAPVKVLQATGKSSRPPPSLEVVEQRKCCHSSGRQGRKGRIHKIRL